MIFMHRCVSSTKTHLGTSLEGIYICLWTAGPRWTQTGERAQWGKGWLLTL